MKIGIDIDGVIADFFSAYELLVIAVSGVNKFGEHRYPAEIPCTWNWPEHYGYSADVMRDVWRWIKTDPTFWERLGDLPDFRVVAAVEMYGGLSAHDVYYITARPGIAVQTQTRRWFAKRLLVPRAILISDQKGLCARALQLDFYIDDKGENILDVEAHSPQTRAYLLNRPYNANFTVIRRAETVEEVFRKEGILAQPR